VGVLLFAPLLERAFVPWVWVWNWFPSRVLLGSLVGSVWADGAGRMMGGVGRIGCCVLLTSLYLKKLFKKNKMAAWLKRYTVVPEEDMC